MAVVGGINSNFQHGTHGALTTLTDFSAKTQEASFDSQAEQVDSTSFGSGYRSYTQSFKNASVKSKYIYDPTIFGQLGDLYNNGETVSFQLAPNGTATGQAKVTGSMFMKTMNTPVQIGNLLVLEVEWQVTGAVTFATF